VTKGEIIAHQGLKSDGKITDKFSGNLIHDCWASYVNFKCSDHGSVGTHLLRESRELSENHARKRATRMLELLTSEWLLPNTGRCLKVYSGNGL